MEAGPEDQDHQSWLTALLGTNHGPNGLLKEAPSNNAAFGIHGHFARRRAASTAEASAAEFRMAHRSIRRETLG